MGKVYNITDKMQTEKPQIVWGDKTFTVNDEFLTLLKFDEINLATKEGLDAALEITLGKDCGIKLETMSSTNINTLMTAIISAIQGITFEEAEARFQGIK